MNLDTITVDDFKTKFFRDFPYWSPAYTDAETNYILDQDITNAFQEAKVVFNPALFGSDDEIKLGYLYLTAHYLCIDIANANAGLTSAGSFPVSSRSVGSVSESYAVPDAFTDNPVLMGYMKTGYGAKYLSLLLPRIVGNVVSVAGGTNA